VEAANAFLRQHYIGEFNRRFQVASAQPGSAFVPYRGKDKDLERIFSLQFERTVNRGQHGQLSEPDFADRARALRGTLAGCAVIVCQHLDGTLSLSYGPHSLGRYDERGGPILNSKPAAGRAMEKTRAGKVQKPTFPPRLEIPQSARDPHFPTDPAAAGG
jgi:hypothetical protein